MRQGALAAGLVAVALAGCGGGGDDSSSTTTSSSQPDGTTLTASFDDLATQAYQDAGKDRQQDYTGGTTVDGCFIADDETATAIGDAAGFEVTFAQKNNYLQGLPDQQERLLCSVEPPPGADHPVIASVSAGTTTLTPDQTLANLQRVDKSTKELDGTAPGLDPDSVLAVEGGGISQFIWIDGDFTVALSGLSDKLTPDQGFAALAAAVDGVSRTLSQ
jgi:hypothetical protein